MLVVLYQLLFAPLVYDILSNRLNNDFEDELAPEKPMRPIFFFLFFVMPLQEGRMKNRTLVFTPIASWTVFFTLLLLKISDVGGLSWLVVFVPLYIFGVYAVILPMVVRPPVLWVDHVVPSALSLFFLAFFIILALKLENMIHWSWFKVMIPLFMLKGFLMVVPTVLSILSKYCYFWMEMRSRWHTDAGAYCLLAVVLAVFLLGPLLAFEVLLAQRLDGLIDSPYSLVSIYYVTPYFLN